MTKNCKKCGSAFEITQDNLTFYDGVSPVFAGKKYAIPPPTICPDCRAQRRFAYRNERTLYRRPCGLCGKSIISAFSPDKPFTVYCQDCWWGDKWDALSYGKEFDFSRGFFEQYQELQQVVPRLAVMNKAAENSEYCNYAAYNKNCYLAVGGSWYNEGCLYGTYYAHSKDSVDCYGLLNGELCYEVTWGEKLYGCAFCTDCFNSSDCFFSSNLRGCKNCFLCVNLRNKEHYIRNQPATQEQIESLRQSLADHATVRTMMAEFLKLRRESIRPSSLNINCENCTGDYLRNCRNVFGSFEATGIEDGKYLFRCEESKDLMDCGATGYNGSQLFYETINAGDGGERNLFSFNNWACSNVAYCDTPQSSQNCFGCVSMKRGKFCILNRQYGEEEYGHLVTKIVDHMKQTGEWGEFFPMPLSPFCYNETVAYEFYPLSKEAVLARGYAWKDQVDEAPQVEKVLAAAQLPGRIKDVPDDILRWAVQCEKTGRPFRIIKQELDFYRKFGLPIPHLHPEERHRRRMLLRNPSKLWERQCRKCDKIIHTSYVPDRPEIVYCEECYLKEVY